MMGHLLPLAVFGTLAQVMREKVQAVLGSPVGSIQLASSDEPPIEAIGTL